MKKIILLLVLLAVSLSMFGCSEELSAAFLRIYDTDTLIEKINELEKDLPTVHDKEKLLPYFVVLEERGSELSEEKIISLIEDDETNFGIETVLVKIYFNNSFDAEKMLVLIDNEDISAQTKEQIVVCGDYPADDLSGIFKKFDNGIALCAMKRICTLDVSMAYALACEILKNEPQFASNEKQRSAFLGVAAYFESHKDTVSADEKREIAHLIFEIYHTSKDESVKDEAVYALARIGDYELFSMIIEDDGVDFYLKVSTIERNVPMMIERIKSADKADEIGAIIAAMRLHPIVNVGEALEAELNCGSLEDSEEIRQIIEYIYKNGIIFTGKTEDKK